MPKSRHFRASIAIRKRVSPRSSSDLATVTWASPPPVEKTARGKPKNAFSVSRGLAAETAPGAPEGELHAQEAGEQGAVVLLVVVQMAAVVLETGPGSGAFHAPAEAMGHSCRGGDDHAEALLSRAQAEIDVLLVQEERLVETPEALEQAAAGEEAGPRHPGRLDLT